jgi:hypothetical protein
MPTKLLNDDGTASMATMLMSSHHAFRRDLACFAQALANPEATRLSAVAEEWTRFRGALHGHHTIEDTSMFPMMRTQHPELAATFDQLDADHRAIDPLLERGDAVFAALPQQLGAARDVISTLIGLLAKHLDTEEPAITPHLRNAKEFPAPPDDASLAMYADGFAWSTAGLAPSVVEQILAMLPRALSERIPAARITFDERCTRVWGRTIAGASTTSAPSL